MNQKHTHLFWLFGLLNILSLPFSGHSYEAETPWEDPRSLKSAKHSEYVEKAVEDHRFGSNSYYSDNSNDYVEETDSDDKSGSDPFHSAYDYQSALAYLSGARIEGGYNFGKFIGIRHSYAELGLFLPVRLSDFMCFESDLTTFADVRGYYFNNSKNRWGASAGVGVRTWLDEGILGANFYYDFLQGHHRTCHNRGFNRLGFGVEWLGPCFDFRANAYFPVGKRSHSRRFIFNEYIGDYVVIAKDTQFVVGEGFDAELGTPIYDACDFRIYAAAGPYYFQTSHCYHYWGGQARLELNWRSYLSLQVRTSYDDTNHSHTQGRILVSIPFDVFCGCNYFEDFCSQLLYQPVRRTGIIFTDHCCSYKKNW